MFYEHSSGLWKVHFFKSFGLCTPRCDLSEAFLIQGFNKNIPLTLGIKNTFLYTSGNFSGMKVTWGVFLIF